MGSPWAPMVLKVPPRVQCILATVNAKHVLVMVGDGFLGASRVQGSGMSFSYKQQVRSPTLDSIVLHPGAQLRYKAFEALEAASSMDCAMDCLWTLVMDLPRLSTITAAVRIRVRGGPGFPTPNPSKP